MRSLDTLTFKSWKGLSCVTKHLSIYFTLFPIHLAGIGVDKRKMPGADSRC
jgi:hypothetical protein